MYAIPPPKFFDSKAWCKSGLTPVGEVKCQDDLEYIDRMVDKAVEVLVAVL
jgi:hypothetical protein